MYAVQRRRSWWLLLLLLLAGAFVGGIVGELLGPVVPIAARSVNVGVRSLDLQLGVLSVALSASMDFNLGTAAGFLFALALFRRF